MNTELDLTGAKCTYETVNRGTRSSAYDSEHHHPDIRSQWEWMAANLIMVEEAGECSTWTRINSHGSLLLQNSKMDIVEKAQVSLTVQMIPSLNYDVKRKEWSWHKSWIIPKLTVLLDFESSRYPIPKDLNKYVKDLLVEVHCVRPSSRNCDELAFIDVGLYGLTRKKGELFREVTFYALKFKTTSYKNEGYMFNILVIVRQKVNYAYSTVIASRISPPVFIDSRKVIQNPQPISLLDLYSTAISNNLFSPDAFSKELVKKSRSATSDIANNISGLYEYLTAANIRNKIKNPFYLAYRFSNCISLFFNSSKVKDLKNIVSMYMEEQEYCSLMVTKKKKNKLAKRDINRYIDFNNECIIVLVIQNLNQEITLNKIIERYGHYYEGVLYLTSESIYLPENFRKMDDISEIVPIYSAYYSKKINSKQIVKKAHYDNESDMRRLCGYRLKNYSYGNFKKIEILQNQSKEKMSEGSIKESTELTIEPQSKLLHVPSRLMTPLFDIFTNNF